MKKRYIELPPVTEFFETLPEEVQMEYEKIIGLLEEKGTLVSPYGEKVEKGLFAIRILRHKNVRVFYGYMKDDEIYGIHAYEKKSRKIPTKELKQARKIMKMMR